MGATYFKNALSATRDVVDIDWDALEEAWSIIAERSNDEDYKRRIEGVNALNDGRFQGARRDTTGSEVVRSPRQEELDLAGIQHRGVPDIEE